MIITIVILFILPPWSEFWVNFKRTGTGQGQGAIYVKEECQPTWRQQVFSVRPLYCGEIENQEIIRASLSKYCEWTFNVLFARYWCGLIFLQYYVSLCLIITSVGVWGYLRFVGVCMLFCVCSLWECMFGVLWQCVWFFLVSMFFVFEVCENVCFVYCVYYGVCSV